MSVVLVADDHEDARMSLGILLQAHGHKVRGAADGAEAMERMRQQTPDVVILDLFMPRVNGWEFLDMKAQSPLAGVPVIVLSGWANIHQRITEGAGVVAVFEKGCDPAEVVRAVEKVVGNHRPASQ